MGFLQPSDNNPISQSLPADDGKYLALTENIGSVIVEEIKRDEKGNKILMKKNHFLKSCGDSTLIGFVG